MLYCAGCGESISWGVRVARMENDDLNDIYLCSICYAKRYGVVLIEDDVRPTPKRLHRALHWIVDTRKDA